MRLTHRRVDQKTLSVRGNGLRRVELEEEGLDEEDGHLAAYVRIAGTVVPATAAPVMPSAASWLIRLTNWAPGHATSVKTVAEHAGGT